MSIKKLLPIPIPPTSLDSMIGAGFQYHSQDYITHTTLPLDQSAIITLFPGQKIALFTVILFSLVVFIIDPKFAAVSFVALLSALYFLDLIFSFLIIGRSLHKPPEISLDPNDLKSLISSKLPVYTVLCPLYKEDKVLPQFVEAISRLDWPKDKLDVILLLESDDQTTINAAMKLHLPSYIRVVIVPNSQPKTKPKACNYGLNLALGEFIVVYDAEDKPDPYQLKKAYLGFLHSGSQVACLQAKLNYYNPYQNFLTRLFTAEYSLWFDVVLPGYQSINTAIPLGGTSNHFRTSILKQLKGWDAFNVTEDCDLGARLFKMGYQTALIDSTTYEEANSKLPNWIRQRSRWIKGYIQTWLVHNRHPQKFIQTHGWHAFIFQLVIGGKTLFTIINPLLWITTLSYFLAYQLVGPQITALYPPVIFYLAGFSAVFGNFLFLYYYMIGLVKREHWSIIKFVYFVPIYWALVSFSAVKAIIQLITKPYYWEKTPHGLVASSKPRLPKLSWNISVRIPIRYQPALMNFSLALFWLFTLSILSQMHPSYLVLTICTSGYILSVLFIKHTLINRIKVDLFPKRGLKILIFNWRDTKHIWAGGAEVYLHQIAKRWVQLGHNITWFCGNDGHCPNQEQIDGINIIRRGGFFTVYLYAIFYLVFVFRRKFDLIIDSENGIPFFTPLFTSTPKILVIYHVHGEMFRNRLYFPLDQLALVLETYIMPLVYRYQKIVTISDSSKKDILSLRYIQSKDISIVNPGVDIPKNIKTNKTPYPSFVYLGRLRAQKNVDIAIKAFSEVLKNYPQAKLTIAGWGETLTDLRHLSKSLGINKSVEFLSWVSEEEKSRVLAQSWVALQPSSIEGWGITVIEANSYKTPVIASNIGGLRDSIVSHKTGILVPVKDPIQLSKAMVYLIKNRSYLLKLSQNAYAWSFNFNWDKTAQDFLSVIHEKLPQYQPRPILPSMIYIHEQN